VLTDQKAARTIIAATLASIGRSCRSASDGIEVLTVRRTLRKGLPARPVESAGGAGDIFLLVEGGGETITSFLHLNLADRLVTIIAPR